MAVDATESLQDQINLAQLQTSEIHYRRLFETARDGILILDVGTRQITDANPFMVELLGYTRDEFIGKELWEIGLLQDEQASAAAFRALQEHGYIRYEDLPLQTKTGQRREVEFVSNVYTENEHEVVQCNIRDITARKRGAVEAANRTRDALATASAEPRQNQEPVSAPDEDSDQIKSFVEYQVNALLKRTYAQAGFQQAAQEQAASVGVKNAAASDERDLGAAHKR